MSRAVSHANEPLTFLRLPEVVKRTGLSKTEIYRRIEEGSFPKQRKKGPRLVFWLNGEILKWQLDILGDDGADIL